MSDDDDLYDELDEDFCDHEDRDVDILTGRAICYRCGESWWMSDREMRQEPPLFVLRCEETE